MQQAAIMRGMSFYLLSTTAAIAFGIPNQKTLSDFVIAILDEPRT